MPPVPTPNPRSPRPDDHDYPMAGETLGLWRLTAGIGRGGMGEVYAAEYDYGHIFATHAPRERRDEVRKELLALPRGEQAGLAGQLLGISLPAEAHFAIKICNARSGTPGYRRFLQEAQLAERLGDHPYIVTVHAINGAAEDAAAAATPGTSVFRRLELDRGKYRDLAFMVMDLANTTFDRTQLAVGEAVHIVRCIAMALDHAHGQGVVHRDLKPENILGTIDHPLLTDFGIAKEIDASEGLTRTGQIIGTLDYMSPEQATDAKHVDHRSDIYSLGVVLYEFATNGALPYSHKNDRDSCLAAIRSEGSDPKWPREQRAGFPAGLEYVILKAMAFRKEDRYQSMAEFIADLDRFTRGERVGWIGRVPLRGMARFQVRHHPRLVWGTAAAVALPLLALGVVWFSRVIDRERRAHEKDLERLDDAVAEIRSGARAQFGRDDLDRLGRLQALKSDASYELLRERLLAAEDQLLSVRSLRAVFRPDRARGEKPQGDALDELKLAAGVASAPWHPTDEGLRVSDASAIQLRPYGKGTVFVWVVAALTPTNGTLLRLTETAYPSHQTWINLVGDQLQVVWREDEKQPVVLRQERLASPRVSFAVELGPERIRTWIGRGEQVHRVRGLADRAPAAVTLQLPANTVLERLEVQPREWR
jgi:serine/threonine protein kinase